ncbi:MAG: selenocysteine-specific translation elongation factor [Chloroflexi bacterium]|nr:selenocysteine-specific translation elongation factor [Chloroflexota bacterium]
MPTAPMPTVVIGTAGHIDHGKTTLLRALTGIDADRLPEERERGMTIDVGFAHLDLDDGTSLDFVDVPGHDRLVGNMLVGAGEIDAVLLVVAADDGPRAQTLEHLELLSALGLRRGVVALTKTDVADAARVAEVATATRSLVDRTSLAGAPIVEVSAQTGSGLPELRLALVALRDVVQGDLAGRPAGPLRLPIDRAFTVRGRGSVVTGTLRGGSVAAGDVLRLDAAGGPAASTRVREVQVHHGRAARADGGRAALNLAGAPADVLRRGAVLTSGPGVEVSDRLLVALAPPVVLHAGVPPAPTFRWPQNPSASARLHLWTETIDTTVRPTGASWIDLGDGRVAATLSLANAAAVLAGARGVLRDPGPGRVVGAVTVLDARPPRGVSRRRVTTPRLAALAGAIERADAEAAVDALTELHGAIGTDRLDALAAALGSSSGTRPRWLRLAADIAASLSAAAVELAARRPSIAELRPELMARLRRQATIERSWSAMATEAIDRVIADLVAAGRLARDGDRVGVPLAEAASAAVGDARAAALARLVAALDADVPPSLAEAARAAACSLDAILALEQSGRIVRVEDDLAWAASRYASLRDRALAMARLGPLTPAAFRDAIGGNRRVALALLEDLGRKGLLRRTDAGHVPGPRAPAP